MGLDRIIRSFMVAGLVSAVVVIIEAAYYGLHPENSYAINNAAYSVSAPFVNNFSEISSPINLMVLIIIFISSFLLASNFISKRQRA
jgi:hypothetical protein